MRIFKFCFVTAIAIALFGCSGAPVSEHETLDSLSQRSIKIDTSKPVNADLGSAISAYEVILEKSDDKMGVKAMRNLADLELQRIEMMLDSDESHLVDESSYDKAIKWYREILLNHPKYPDREQVLYNLARAYQESGRLDKTLKVLKIISRDYPGSPRVIETGFRRGELLFRLERFREAEIAYAEVITTGRGTSYYDRALFKYAWSIYRQDRCSDSLNAFFAILDLKLSKNVKPSELVDLSFLSGADKELVNDSFRTINLCFTAEDGAVALTRYLENKTPRIYEFILYKSLADHYESQKLSTKAAETLGAFSQRAPWHPYALMFQDDAINIYLGRGMGDDVLASKIKYVGQYEALKERWSTTNHNSYFEFLLRSDKETQAKLLEKFESHLFDVAEHFHAVAQKSKTEHDYKISTEWYKRYLKQFKRGGRAPLVSYRLGEALFENKQYLAAAREYERAAYKFGKHENANAAGYAALVAYEEHQKGQKRKRWMPAANQSALSFARVFRKDPRAPGVLAKAADQLYRVDKFHAAVIAAETLLNRYPKAEEKDRRIALIVLANIQFEQSEYEVAELFYVELDGLLDKDDPLKGEVTERIAASIYKQAEHFRKKGAMRGAIEQFERLIDTVPESTVVPIAKFDMATSYIQINEWEPALEHLKAFREDYPDHTLTEDVNEKIAIGYLRLEKPVEAAAELEGIAAGMDPEAQREALWQVAELYEKGGDLDKAAKAFVNYSAAFPKPLEQSIEALYKAAMIYKNGNKEKLYFVQMEKIYTLDKLGGDGRTARTRYLAAKGVFELAEPHYVRYESIRLVEPIRTNMQLKNSLMKKTLNQYNKAVEIGVAEFTTAATYRIAELYADFSRKLMDSDRPSELNELELEEYEIMLEEQAFPFEEKAIGLHETNLEYLKDELYNEWIQKSIKSLAELMPGRYLREEYHDVAAPTLD